MNPERIRIFVGYDVREAVAFPVFVSSVMRRTRAQVSFTPVGGDKRDGSNAFVYERFRVAEMCGFEGWALYADGDMLCRADIAELWAMRDERFDVMVAKHEYRTRHPVKYLGQKNEDYPRKNWSSLMLVNCPRWRGMTSGRIAAMTGAQLHRFEFMDQARVGSLPIGWNWLVGEYPFNADAKLVHFTIGSPCWKPFVRWDYADEWRAESAAMLSFAEWEGA